MGSAFFTPPPPQPSKKPIALVALVALIVLCGLAVVVLVVLTTGGEDKATEASQKPEEQTAASGAGLGEAPPTEPAETAAVDDSKPDEEVIKITIQSTPEGAEVFRESESVGTTPFSKDFPKGEGSEVWQVFYDGYEVKEVEVSLVSAGLYEVNLSKVEEGDDAAAAAAAAQASSGGSDDGDDKKKKKKKKKKKGRKTISPGSGSFTIPD